MNITVLLGICLTDKDAGELTFGIELMSYGSHLLMAGKNSNLLTGFAVAVIEVFLLT